MRFLNQIKRMKSYAALLCALLVLAGCDDREPPVPQVNSDETTATLAPVSALVHCYGKLVANTEVAGSGVFVRHISFNNMVYTYFATARHVLESSGLSQAQFYEFILMDSKGRHILRKFEKRSAMPFMDAQNNADLALIALPSESELEAMGTAISWVVYDSRKTAETACHSIQILETDKRTDRPAVEVGTETWMFGALDTLGGVMEDRENETPVAVWRGSVAMAPRGRMKLIYGATPVIVLQTTVWEVDSGGPVFVRSAGNGQPDWLLLGILAGYVNGREFSEGVLKNRSDSSMNKRVFENSGYAYLTPSTVLVKMLQQLELDLAAGMTSHGGGTALR